MIEPSYPGAADPERSRMVDSAGIRIHTLEWGDPQAPPVVLCHGMWDHARSFAVVAPLLAQRFRVIAIDARGHGESEWADAYMWNTDVLDVINVLRSLGRPAHLIGHSKGGGQATDAACVAPELVRRLVNIDGFGPPDFQSDSGSLPRHLAEFLDLRRRMGRRRHWRAYPSLDALVERRRAQNPRLTPEWLRYFVYHGAREHDGSWSWKSDPLMGPGFGPWRPEWIGPGWEALRAPMLAVIGSEQDTWGPLPEEILAERLTHVKDLSRCTVDGAGHFVHIERPVETADAILDFLDN